MTSLWFRYALLSDGWATDVRLVIDNGCIDRIARGVEPTSGDERHAIAVPGLPNLHSHAFQRGMAGLAEMRGPASDSFWTWREVMYRFVDRMEPADLEAIAAQAYVEMLEAGFTRVGEFHYLHHARDGARYGDVGELASRIASAAAETGIALTLLPVFYAHGGFGGQPTGAGQRRFVTDPAHFAKLMEASRRAIAPLAGAVLGVAPHSLRAATTAEIAAILPLAEDGPVHIHVAEQTKEVDDCLAWCGRRPVDLLLDHAPVDTRWCLVHATHMSEAELARLAASGAVVGLCPITEANLGDGIFPAQAFIAAGGCIGVGSDSNVLIDAAEELRLLEYSQRLTLRARNVLALGEGRASGRSLFDAALAGGAQALGASAGLAEGLPADMLSLDARHPCLAARAGDAVLDGWIFAAATSPVDCVWRHGVKLVSGGRHHRREAVADRFRTVLEHLLA
jgi:formimidoylglutamate deiminase